MSFLQSVLSLDKTIEGINSILPIVSLWSISQHLLQGSVWHTYIKLTFAQETNSVEYFIALQTQLEEKLAESTSNL